MNKKGTLLAILAAVFYAISIPISKILLNEVEPTMLAALLYLGAGIGIGILSLFSNESKKSQKLVKSDLPYVAGMIILDIIAPICLLVGVKYGSSSSASLLGNLEIVATSLIALVLFREGISNKLWKAIFLITLSGIILSLNTTSGFQLSVGSLFVLLATLCWGLENNCTNKISKKSTYEIVFLKGIFSGSGSLIIAFIIGENLPEFKCLFIALLLGFVAYGLSIFFYVRAQNILGAAKTSAFYAINPFVGSFLSFILLEEKITYAYLLGLIVMIIGTILVIQDTLDNK